jgi:hypothetical protein
MPETDQEAHRRIESVLLGAIRRGLAPTRKNRQSHHLNRERVITERIIVLGALRYGCTLMPETDRKAHPSIDSVLLGAARRGVVPIRGNRQTHYSNRERVKDEVGGEGRDL